MNTELLEEKVHDAVLVSPTGPSQTPIKFDVTAAAIEEMKQKAASLTIAGPDDKNGYKAVYEFRQVVKKQRIAVEKKADELKAPHLAYNKQVNSTMKQLVEPMEAIENDLSVQEKAYNDERERIAEEKALAERIRYSERTKFLQERGFTYDAVSDSFGFGETVILVDDIRDLSDEDYAPTVELVNTVYQAEQDRLVQIEANRLAEAGRIEAEQQQERERLEAERRELEAAKAKLRADQAEADRIIREQYDREVAQEQERLRIEEEARYQAELIRQEKEQQERDKAQRKADRERTKRLAPDKKALVAYFSKVKVIGPAVTMYQPETSDLYDSFFSAFGSLVMEHLKKLDAI
ncbi:hypothetical protein [Spirosoma fluminis]